MDVIYRPMDEADVDEVNRVHVAAFMDLEQREGIRNIGARLRVPEHFKMYLGGNESRSFVAIADEKIVGYCFANKWGQTGWLGPLGVHPDFRRKRVGTEIVFLSMESLIGQNVLTLGLESIPQSMSNLSFYLRLGFHPLKLTFSLSRRVMYGGVIHEFSKGLQVLDYAQLNEAQRARFLKDAGGLASGLSPNLELTNEIVSTESFQFGTTLFFVAEYGLAGFAICHHRPYFMNADDSVLRIKNLLFRDNISQAHLNTVLEYLDDHAWNMGRAYVQIGINSHHWMWLNHVMSLGFEIDIANLRMIYPGYDEEIREESPLFSRWVG